MRAFVVAGLVVFHSAMVFGSGVSWFVKAPHPSLGFTVFLVWGSLWGMPLLFMVSGMAARYAMRTRSVAVFAGERLARLLIPFVVGLAVLVPPMFYLGWLAQPGFREPYWRFWLSFMNVPALARGLLPRGSWTSGGMSFDPAHLWFLFVLVAFSIVLLPLFGWLQRPQGTAVTRWLAGFAERHGIAVLCAAAVPLMVTEAVFGPDGNTGGWERLAYVFPFLYGFVIASQPQLEAMLRRFRWWALAAGCAATAALGAWAAGLTGSGGTLGVGVPPGLGALQGLAGTGQAREPPGAWRIRPAAGCAARPSTVTRLCCRSTRCTSRSSWPLPGSSSAGACRAWPSTWHWSCCRSPPPSAYTRPWSDGSVSPGSCSA